jgi:hypothetical protein
MLCYPPEQLMDNSLLLELGLTTSASNSAHRASQAVIIYSDEATHRWAEKAFAKAAGDQRHAFRSTWWKMSDLSQPGVLAGAVSSAMRSQLIIVATRSGGNFPLPFYIWASSWLPHYVNSGGSLIGLIGTNGESGARNYLLSLARIAGLAASIEERDLPTTAVPGERASRSRTTKGHVSCAALEPSFVA